MGLSEVIGDFFPEAKWQRCVVHWYHNAFSMCPKKHIKPLAAMLKAIRAQGDREAALEKSGAVQIKLHELRLDKMSAGGQNGRVAGV